MHAIGFRRGREGFREYDDPVASKLPQNPIAGAGRQQDSFAKCLLRLTDNEILVRYLKTGKVVPGGIGSDNGEIGELLLQPSPDAKASRVRYQVPAIARWGAKQDNARRGPVKVTSHGSAHVKEGDPAAVVVRHVLAGVGSRKFPSVHFGTGRRAWGDPCLFSSVGLDRRSHEDILFQNEIAGQTYVVCVS